MIRIEGIPIVAARLEAAQKATARARKRTRVKMAVNRIVRPAVASVYATMKKSA